MAIGPASGQPLLSSYYGDHARLGMARLGLGLGLGLAVAAVALAWLGFLVNGMYDSLTTRVRILHCAYLIFSLIQNLSKFLCRI